jgi:cysteine-S-conjugate beta-lyase
VTSASKAWNVAGLKCALVIGGDASTAEELARLPVELRHPGHHGALAATAAFASAADGDGWLDEVTGHLQRQHDRAVALLASALPKIEAPCVDAGYLLWLDCRALGLGDDPAAEFLARGRVALSPGLEFGSQGSGFARLNVATSGALLAEAVRRMRAAVDIR